MSAEKDLELNPIEAASLIKFLAEQAVEMMGDRDVAILKLLAPLDDLGADRAHRIRQAAQLEMAQVTDEQLAVLCKIVAQGRVFEADIEQLRGMVGGDRR